MKLPDHEGLRRAVAWLLDQPTRDTSAIEDAALRFDLSPLDQEFLRNHFAHGDGRAVGAVKELEGTRSMGSG
jgi:hypothetical protein